MAALELYTISLMLMMFKRNNLLLFSENVSNDSFESNVQGEVICSVPRLFRFLIAGCHDGESNASCFERLLNRFV